MEKSVQSIVAHNIRLLREEAGMSQTELAEQLTANGHPMTLKVISKLERGDRNISVDDLVAFGAVFDRSIEVLCTSVRELDVGDAYKAAQKGKRLLEKSQETREKAKPIIKKANEEMWEAHTIAQDIVAAVRRDPDMRMALDSPHTPSLLRNIVLPLVEDPNSRAGVMEAPMVFQFIDDVHAAQAREED